MEEIDFEEGFSPREVLNDLDCDDPSVLADTIFVLQKIAAHGDGLGATSSWALGGMVPRQDLNPPRQIAPDARRVLEGSFWPELKPQLAAIPDGAWHTAVLECAICLDPLRLVGRYDRLGRPEPPKKRSRPGREAAIVIPCGHVFGKGCLDAFRRDSDSSDCPLCRAEMDYVCGQWYEDLPLPCNADEMQRFPDFFFTEDHIPPEECRRCEWINAEWRPNWVYRAMHAAVPGYPRLARFLSHVLRMNFEHRPFRGGDPVRLPDADWRHQTAEVLGFDPSTTLEGLIDEADHVLDKLITKDWPWSSWAVPSVLEEMEAPDVEPRPDDDGQGLDGIE